MDSKHTLTTGKPYILIISLISFLFSACVSTNHVKTEDCPVIDVDVKFESATDDAGLFFDRYEYAILQSNGEIPLGSIDLIELTDKMIVVASGSVIHIYDREGKEISCFDRKGHGPGEYLQIQDLSCTDDRIYVLSWRQKKILEYDLHGKCIDTYDLPYAYAALQNTENGIWLASESDNDSKYDFSLYDSSHNKMTVDCLPFEQNQSTHSTIGVFNPFVFSSSEEMLVVKQYDYTVYGLTKDGAYSAWTYQFNTPKQISDFGKDLNYVELYQALGNQPVVMWPGVLWKGKNTIYQTLSIFHIIGRFTNIYKFSLEDPEKKGELLHIGLKTYDDFPFLRTQVKTIYDGNYISTMSLTQALDIAKTNGIAFEAGEIEDEDTQVIFFHHFRE